MNKKHLLTPLLKKEGPLCREIPQTNVLQYKDTICIQSSHWAVITDDNRNDFDGKIKF